MEVCGLHGLTSESLHACEQPAVQERLRQLGPDEDSEPCRDASPFTQVMAASAEFALNACAAAIRQGNCTLYSVLYGQNVVTERSEAFLVEKPRS